MPYPNALGIVPPSKRRIQNVMWPLRQYFAPRFYGLESYDPAKPALIVSNHTVFGLTDGFFVGSQLYEDKGVLVRTMADQITKSIPIWKDFVRSFGVIPGSRESCQQLMDLGETIMVFPGGTREACKHKGEAYQLTWKSRLGFVKLAIKNGYDIVPVAGLGGEELYRILFDSQDIMASPIGKFLKRTNLIHHQHLKGGENIPPLARGIGLTNIPKPERLYYYFGDRIDTTRFAGQEENEEVLFGLRGEVEKALYDQLDELRAFRTNDTEEEWWRKLLKMM